MDAHGIGGASPLDRFQQVRDLARKKIDGDENRARLADLLKKKQAELGQGVALDRPRSAPRAAAAQGMEPPAGGIAPASLAGLGAAGGLAAYGSAGGVERKPSGPGLGRYIDLTA